MDMDRDMDDLDGAVVVAVGGNLPGAHDSVQAGLMAALDRLEAEGLAIVARSSWWTSRAWPDPTDPPFVNAAILIRTNLDPASTLAVLHRVEAAFGRRRSDFNAPRALDLDLIAHGRTVMGQCGSVGLTLPHPRAHERAFVMGPLAQIAPTWRHPTLGSTAAHLAKTAPVGADARPLID